MNLTGSRCQCGGCGEYFNSVWSFDRHRVGEHGVSRSCRTPAQMEALGWQKLGEGWWSAENRTRGWAARRADPP